MLNQVQKGDAVYVVAPSGGFTSGKPYLIGTTLFGVAGFTCLVGATGVLWTTGVFSLAKTSAQAWVVGDPIYWNTSTKLADNVSSTGLRIGVATATAANPSAVGEVRLDGQMLSGGTASGVGGVGSNYNIARGVYTSAAAVGTVVTGLSTVVSVVASLQTTPAAAHAFVTADIGDQAGAPAAGSVYIKTWTSAYSAELTPWGTVAEWIAIGT